MLMLTISNRKKPVSYTYVPPTNNHVAASNAVNLSIYNEAKRRSAIVQKLAEECTYTEGDIVATIKPSDGDIRVIRICRDYIHMGKDEDWPKSDNPFLVTAQYVKDNKIFNCTINYLQKKV